MCRLLLDHGASANETDEDGDTPLHDAALGGHLEVVRVLLKHPAVDGADLTAQCRARNNDGWTALHKAAEDGHLEICRLLLQHGALVDETDNHGVTPTYLTAAHGKLDVVCFLLKYRAKGVPQVRPLERKTRDLVREHAERDKDFKLEHQYQAILEDFAPQFEDAQDEPKMEQTVLEGSA